MSDVQGDVVLVTGAPGAPSIPVAGADADSADLLWLDIVEEDETFTLDVAVATMTGNAGFEIDIEFEWNGLPYVVEARRSNPTIGGGFAFATLLVYNDEDEDFDRLALLEMTLDVEKAVASIIVPKVFVLDRAERTPTRGDSIAVTRVVAEETVVNIRFSDTAPLSMRDEMPDEAGEPVKFTFTAGDAATGHLKLVTDDRVRVSNGGATTFVFQATLRNNASYEEDVTLALESLPEGWQGTVQSPVRVPASGERTLAVLMSVPFEHDHGGFDSFNLTAKSRKDVGSMATVRFGVLHTPIPQPAGHHEELFLHGHNDITPPFDKLFPFADGYINTESTHEGDIEGVPTSGFIDGSTDSLSWYLQLDPALRMGLDFDLNRTGEVVGSIRGRDATSATVTAKLFLYKYTQEGRSEGTLLAQAAPAEVQLDLNNPSPFKLTLAPTPESDYIPYDKDQNLVLQLTLKPDGGVPMRMLGVNGPTLTTGDFKAQLPLNEYHDQLTGVAEAATALDLRATGPVEKLANPGNLVAYEFTLVNGASVPTRIDIDLAGNDARLGTLVPSGSVELIPGESRTLTLGVRVPGDAAEGDELEVLVFAHAQDDPSQMAIARTKTTVTLGDGAVDDETETLIAARERQRDAPGPGALLLLAAAAVAVGLTRRARK